MTLGQFACAMGVSPKWVQNTWAVLGLPPSYRESDLWHLALVQLLERALGIPLKRAYAMARAAAMPTAASGATRELRFAGEGTLVLSVNWSRFSSGVLAGLSRARTQYQERRRGRPPKEPRHGIQAAREQGIDIGLLRTSLKRSAAERLRALDQDVAFVQRLRVQS